MRAGCKMPLVYQLFPLVYSVYEQGSPDEPETVVYFSQALIVEAATAQGLPVLHLDSYRLSGPRFLTPSGLPALMLTVESASFPES